jgi:outer membrane protein assembly factor BamD (BamD/ComL family)
MNSGSYAEAARELRAYLAQHPSTAQSEDAAYLLVVALLHEGDRSAAREAARDYLGRYPHALRRNEVEAFAR